MTPFKAALALLAMLLLSSVVDACPTCKLAIQEGSDHSQQGYALSILFMMAMPFAIATGWTIFIVRSVLQQNKLEQSGESTGSADQALSWET